MMIADDSKMSLLLTRTVIAHMLPKARITEAGNVTEMTDMLQRERPDILFADLGMAGLDETVLGPCYGHVPAVPVIGMAADVPGTTAPGITAVLQKPVEDAAVRDVLDKWLLFARAGTEENLPRFQEGYIFNHVGTDPAMLSDVWQIVIRQLEQDMFQLNKAAGSGMPYLSALKQLGHKLYGGARTVGFLRLASLARQLEFNDDHVRATEMAEQIREEIRCVFPIITEQMEALKQS